jgi:hypothetical protein
MVDGWLESALGWKLRQGMPDRRREGAVMVALNKGRAPGWEGTAVNLCLVRLLRR